MLHPTGIRLLVFHIRHAFMSLTDLKRISWNALGLPHASHIDCSSDVRLVFAVNERLTPPSVTVSIRQPYVFVYCVEVDRLLLCVILHNNFFFAKRVTRKLCPKIKLKSKIVCRDKPNESWDDNKSAANEINHHGNAPCVPGHKSFKVQLNENRTTASYLGERGFIVHTNHNKKSRLNYCCVFFSLSCVHNRNQGTHSHVIQSVRESAIECLSQNLWMRFVKWVTVKMFAGKMDVDSDGMGMKAITFTALNQIDVCLSRIAIFQCHFVNGNGL